MKQIFLILIPLLAAFSASAQKQGVVVMECQGAAVFFAADGTALPVEAGAWLPREGELILGAGASLQVLDGGAVVPVGKAGKYQIQALLPNEQPPLPMGFAGEFMDEVKNASLTVAGQIRKGMGQTDVTPPPPPPAGKKGAGENDITPPPPPPAGKKGMGDQADSPTGDYPVKGKMLAGTGKAYFSAPSIDSSAAWSLTISNPGTGKNILSEKTESPMLEVDLSGLQAGQKYVWKVSQGKTTLMSNEFEMVDAKMMDEAMASVKSEPEYQQAGTVQQKLWEAYALEMEGFFYEANAIYRQLMEEDPDNQLVWGLYQRFWARTR